MTTPSEIARRVEIVKRRDAYERDPEGFRDAWADEERQTRAAIVSARARIAGMEVSDQCLELAAGLCLSLGTDGVRGELTLMRAARAIAALAGASSVTAHHLREAAPMALRHRLRRNPLDETASSARIARVLDEQIPT